MKLKSEDIVEELRRKNSKAMDLAIEKYSNLLNKVVYSVLGSYGDGDYIEECLNDIFLSIWRNIDKFFGDEQKFKNWICAIARHKSIDYSRKKARLRLLDNIDDLNIVGNEYVEERLILKEFKDEILTHINKLSELDKNIFLKKYFREMSVEEIANELGLTRGNVNTHLSRSMKVLRRKLKDSYVEVI
ncbi:sigma-70 family RNA polymerase sigma factor [Clostridium sp. 'White wine YQ']|uniref:sigma-70 family RNA polymerase sigma factor n=1 Tax=Clostridium sp. 'White wine YQ' TaxID=3027474 RepID=UPI0023670007|nr:sigma-70 family RNA polymerase sigma factor [Clostridium sp. 'White wine YQ']MDD7795851.1 sigma-70 family RNA polymerase sigma factor [Clostridium sp. 'White wine YQ']